jgi:hypothetical protein
MSGCQNFCICETDSAALYREKSDLALNLDKDDFVVGGYAVDSAKYPLKPPPKGKGKARVVEEEEEEDVDEEEEEEMEAALEDDEPVIEPLRAEEDVDLDAGGSDYMHADPILDSGNHILNVASIVSLSVCVLNSMCLHYVVCPCR